MSRISDIGKADNQLVSVEVVGCAVEELEAEIDRLQHRLGNQAVTIRVQAETIRRLEEAMPKPVAVHPAPNVTRAGGE